MKCRAVLHPKHIPTASCQLRMHHWGAHKGRPISEDGFPCIWLNILWSNENAMEESTRIYRLHTTILFMLVMFFLGTIFGGLL